MNYTVTSLTEDVKSELESAALIDQTGAEIYFTDAWLAAWWKHYGKSFAPSRQSATLVVRNSGKIIAVLPFYTERFWLGPIPVRLARLAGVDPNFAILNLPVAEGNAATVFEAVLPHLTTTLKCDAISFSPISERSAQLTALRSAVAASTEVVLCRDRSQRHHTLMDLPETFEKFFASLSKSRRREHNRDVKRLTEMDSLETRESTSETVQAAMCRFVAQHTTQWETKGKGGHFADWPQAEAFYRDLLEHLSPTGQAGLDELWLGKTLLSSQLRYSQGTKAYWWLNARSTAPEFAKIGLGRVGLVERIGDLLRAGIRTIDAGAGDYEYKLAYGGELVPIHDLLISRRSPLARGRVKMLMIWADVLHLLYYRLWFLKIAPKFGFGSRPLWRAWIRSRF
ncbi:MAG: GNAT family N-acetyltransferase [Roseovarius sp.]|uniref:GNAT family N-acetyltransferase n=1 Tax=Roseovarius sp. TaxID=1486281 RepID=UPI0032F02600